MSEIPPYAPITELSEINSEHSPSNPSSCVGVVQWLLMWLGFEPQFIVVNFPACVWQDANSHGAWPVY